MRVSTKHESQQSESRESGEDRVAVAVAVAAGHGWAEGSTKFGRCQCVSVRLTRGSCALVAASDKDNQRLCVNRSLTILAGLGGQRVFLCGQ